MKNRIIQIILVVFTLLFASSVISVFSADRLYSMSLAVEKGTRPVEQGIALLNAAIKLTPNDARLYSRKYDLMPLATQSAKRIAQSVPSSSLRGPSQARPEAISTLSSRARPLGRVEGSKDTQDATTHNARREPGDLLYERQLQLIARCVNLCPSVASYHFRYALTMPMVHPHLTLMAREFLLSELQKASELKPQDARYRDVYGKYRKRFGF